MNLETAKKASQLQLKISQFQVYIDKLTLVKEQSFKKIYIVLDNGYQFELESQFLSKTVSRDIVKSLLEYNINEYKAALFELSNLH